MLKLALTCAMTFVGSPPVIFLRSGSSSLVGAAPKPDEAKLAPNALGAALPNGEATAPLGAPNSDGAAEVGAAGAAPANGMKGVDV